MNNELHHLFPHLPYTVKVPNDKNEQKRSAVLILD